MNADEKPSEPKINIEAVRAMLGEVLEEKFVQHESRLIDGIGRLLKGEHERLVKAWLKVLTNALGIFKDPEL